MKPARYLALSGVAAALALISAVPANAQRTRAPATDTAYDGSEIPRATRPPDFLFEKPRMSLELRGGINMPRENSQYYGFTRDKLTLSRNSFNAAAVAADLGFRLNERFDLLLGTAYARTAPWSEDRKYEDNNNQPIEQQTVLTLWPLTAGVRAYLLPRGEQIGHFVYVPTRYQPYVGVAVGALRHHFEQRGDFVDYQTLAVFTANYQSVGWSPVGQAFAGVDVGIARNAALQAEARYSYSNAPMGRDFSSFDKLDLSALQTTVGLSFRF